MKGGYSMDIFKSVLIKDGIYWVGNHHGMNGMHSNPYLIVEGDESILIDGGSRPDFSTVMIKIIETGVNPANLSKLIYHHYDPDLCGSISNFESIIKNPEIEIISHKFNISYIEHYSTSLKKVCISDLGWQWVFKSGRLLQFISTPFAHAPGSFVTYDSHSKTLFTSDLFGGIDNEWKLIYEPSDSCKNCDAFGENPEHTECFFSGLRQFHERNMPSTDALYYALDKIASLDIETICPQHGQIIVGKENVRHALTLLRSIRAVGIDRVIRVGEADWM